MLIISLCVQRAPSFITVRILFRFLFFYLSLCAYLFLRFNMYILIFYRVLFHPSNLIGVFVVRYCWENMLAIAFFFWVDIKQRRTKQKRYTKYNCYRISTVFRVVFIRPIAISTFLLYWKERLDCRFFYIVNLIISFSN